MNLFFEKYLSKIDMLDSDLIIDEVDSEMNNFKDNIINEYSEIFCSHYFDLYKEAVINKNRNLNVIIAKISTINLSNRKRSKLLSLEIEFIVNQILLFFLNFLFNNVLDNIFFSDYYFVYVIILIFYFFIINLILNDKTKYLSQSDLINELEIYKLVYEDEYEEYFNRDNKLICKLINRLNKSSNFNSIKYKWNLSSSNSERNVNLFPTLYVCIIIILSIIGLKRI